MASQSFAEVTNTGKTLIAGLRAAESIRGVDPTYIDELEQLLTDVKTLDNEQEAMKAAQKKKTAELNERLNDLKKSISQTNELVKMSIPQEGWKEFGITTSR